MTGDGEPAPSSDSCSLIVSDRASSPKNLLNGQNISVFPTMQTWCSNQLFIHTLSAVYGYGVTGVVQRRGTPWTSLTNYVFRYFIFKKLFLEQSNVTIATAKLDVSSPLGFSKNLNAVC